MNKCPLISIIIPIYKVEQYLNPCVDSVLNQTYKNLEIILVDDGSPDKCPEICDEYAEKDSRIKVVHKKNGGLSDARNAGIEVASGEFLCFVDSDDMIHNRMVEVLLKPLVEDVNLKISACQSFSFNDGESFNSDLEEKPTEIVAYQEYFTTYLWMTTWGKIFHKTLFNDIKFPVGRYHEDEYTTYKVCYIANKIAYTESQLYFYRQREGSIMAKMSVKRMVDTHDALKERLDFFLAHNERELYSRFLLDFVSGYTNRKQYRRTLEGSKPIIALWKSELQNYTLKPLPVKQRIKFIMRLYFPRLWQGLCLCINRIR